MSPDAALEREADPTTTPTDEVAFSLPKKSRDRPWLPPDFCCETPTENERMSSIAHPSSRSASDRPSVLTLRFAALNTSSFGRSSSLSFIGGSWSSSLSSIGGRLCLSTSPPIAIGPGLYPPSSSLERSPSASLRLRCFNRPRRSRLCSTLSSLSASLASASASAASSSSGCRCLWFSPKPPFAREFIKIGQGCFLASNKSTKWFLKE